MSTYCVKQEQAVRYIYTVTDWMRGVWRSCMACQVSDDEETETWRDRCKTLWREESTVRKNLTGTACEGVVWIDVRQVRDWWKTLVNMAMDSFLTSKVRNSLTTLRPGNEIWRITALKDCHRCLQFCSQSAVHWLTTPPQIISTNATHMKRRAMGGDTGYYAGVI